MSYISSKERNINFYNKPIFIILKDGFIENKPLYTITDVEQFDKGLIISYTDLETIFIKKKPSDRTYNLITHPSFTQKDIIRQIYSIDL